MLQSYVIALLLAITGTLSAADPSLFIAPLKQSSLSTYNASTAQLMGGFPVGGNAKALVLSADGTSAYVTATAEGVVRQINLATGKVANNFSTGPDPVALALSPDGTKLYAVTSERQSYLFCFNTSTGSQIGKASAGYQAISVAASTDGKKVYVANLFKIVDFDALTLAATSTIPVEAKTIVFGPSSQVLYAATLQIGQQIEVISTATDTVTAMISAGSTAVNDLAVSADGKFLYAASGQGLLQIDTSTNQILALFDTVQSFTAVSLPSNGSTALCVGAPTVIINLTDGALQPVAANGYASTAVYSPDGSKFYMLLVTTFDIDYADETTSQLTGAVGAVPGNSLLAASLSGNKVGAIYSAAGKFSLIDAMSHTLDKTYSFTPSAGTAGLALNSIGTVALFPVGNPSVLQILNLTNGAATKLSIPNSGPDLYIAVSPDDTTAYVSGPQLCSIDLVTTALTKCGPTITLAYTGLLRTLALDSTGNLIFAIGASSVGEYDASSLNLLKTISLASGQNANGLVYSAATNSIYVIATDTTTATGAVVRIDAHSFTAQANVPVPNLLSDIAVSPDGKHVYLAGFSTQQISVLDGTTLATTGSIGHIQASSVVTAAQ